MEWTQSDTLAMAAHDCTQCHGFGLQTGSRGKSTPCNCVLRAIFRACHNRFRQCVEREQLQAQASLDTPRSSQERRPVWGRKNEEYCADFILVTRRTLTPDEYRIFNAHFLLGADWRLCCRQFKIDRGTFFHAIYRIQQKLGRVYRELEPYALFPLDEYFNVVVGEKVVPIRKTEQVSPSVNFPWRKAA